MRISLILICLILFISYFLNNWAEHPHLRQGKSLENQIECSKLVAALFVYYVDNKRFPTDKEGLVYGLHATGKNAPYFLFHRKRVVRSDDGRPIEEENIQPGDKYLPPYGKEEIIYRCIPQYNFFELISNSEYGKSGGYLNIELFIPKNLSYLRYKKIKSRKAIKALSNCYDTTMGIFHFYLDKKKNIRQQKTAKEKQEKK